MIKLIDCIERMPKCIENIIANYDELFQEFGEYIKGKKIKKIVMIGSGTSNTTSVSAKTFMEKASGLEVVSYYPNDFINKAIFDKDALYLFISQSGTSTLTNKALNKANDIGLYNVALCDDPNSKMVKNAKCYINLMCDNEEYGMRTIGYVCTVLIDMLLAVRYASLTNKISSEEEKNYLEDAKKAVGGIEIMIKKAQKWCETNLDHLIDKKTLIIYGGGSLYGVALEGALKILEISRLIFAVGYEMDDGCHGPTMGFTKDHVIFVMDHDDQNSDTANKLVRFAKGELGKGIVVGNNTIDQDDLNFESNSKEFYALEYVPFFQVLAYELALRYDVELLPTKLMKPLPEKKYFDMHAQ